MSDSNNENKSVPESGEQTPEQTPVQTPEQPAEEAKVTASYSTVKDEEVKQKPWGMYALAVVIVLVTALVVLFMLERSGRVSTGIFDSYLASQEAAVVVATVNGTEIRNSDLTTSIEQFNQAAIAQGVDVSNPEIKADLRAQALDVLINTELLKQEALDRGIEVSDEQAVERLATIEAEIGGAEVLDERMTTLGLNREDLEEDIQDEILIQSLLDAVFAEADIAVTEEEVQEVYDSAGGADAGLPALEEVREQVEAQIRNSKEQEIIDEFLSELKADADIQMS